MAYVCSGRKDTGETFPRREIRDLNENYPEQYSLFVLGLMGVQYPNAAVPLMPADFRPAKLLPPGADYFSIGGIHGIPYERWPGDPPTGMLNEDENTAEVQKAAGSPVKMTQLGGGGQTGASTDGEGRKVPLPGDSAARYGGYCNHASVLFPPWHRPYIMILEQSIGIVATAIAQEFARAAPAGKATKWIEAAKQLRFPFWDWTLPDYVDQGFPDVLESEKVRIRGPNDKSFSVVNPVACFRFNDYIETDRCRDFVDFERTVPYSGVPPVKTTAYFRKWDRTCRWPTNDSTPNDRLDRINFHLARLYDDLRSKVAHMFTYEEDTNPDSWPYFWDEFSNTTVQSNPIAVPNEPGARTTISKSLEAAHNSLHLIVGGNGHMGTNLPADPAFHMHHCNVDRIYALWEYVYPKYMLGSGFKDKDTAKIKHFTQPNGSFVQLTQTRLDQWTDMLPWRKSANSYWTMNDMTSLEKRDDVVPKYYSYPPVDGVDVTKPVPYAERIKMRAVLQRHFGLGVKESQPVVSRNPSPFFQNVAPGSEVPEGRVQLQKYRHFVIVAELKEHAFGDSYSLEMSYTCGGEETFFAQVAVLTRPLATSCAGCQGRRAVGNTVKGMIHVPSKNVAQMLTARGHVGTSEAEEADFCKKRFKAQLVGRTGQVYAHTVNHIGSGLAPEANRLDESITPKVTFVSAYACTGGQSDAPVELFGWRNFSEVFLHANWKMGAP